MRCKKLTIADLRKLLLHLGFEAVPTLGDHRVYRHAPSDTLIFLPGLETDSIVSPAHTAAVRHALIWRGVIEEEALDDLLAAAR